MEINRLKTSKFCVGGSMYSVNCQAPEEADQLLPQEKKNT